MKWENNERSKKERKWKNKSKEENTRKGAQDIKICIGVKNEIGKEEYKYSLSIFVPCI